MRQWDFPSSSSPKIYHTQINESNGLLSCDCPGWTVKKLGKVRECKHTRKVATDENLALTERDGQWFVVYGLVPMAATKVIHKPVTVPLQPQTVTDELQGFVNPMLASKMPDGKTVDDYDTPDYIMEEKFDGHRIIVRVESKVYGSSAMGHGIGGQTITRGDIKVTAWSRLGNTRTLPDHIRTVVEELPDGLYDGELIVPGQHSYDVTEGQNSGTEALVLFDLIEALDTPIAKEPYSVRRNFLEVAYSTFDLPGWESVKKIVILAPQMRPEKSLVQEIWDRGGEGAIIKDTRSKYQPGWRTPDWIKVKAVLAATLMVTGYEASKNGPYSITKLMDDKGIETTVKTLDNQTLREIAADQNHFLGRRVVISYQEKMPSGKYRHPMWDHFAGEGE